MIAAAALKETGLRRGATRTRCLVALLTTLVLAVTNSAAAQLTKPVSTSDRVLVIGTKVAAPFSMKSEDGTWSGISIDLWRRIAEQLHLRYRFTETTLEKLIEDTAAGSLDAAVAALTVTAEREQMLDFTQPFYTTGLGIAVPKSAQFNWWRLWNSLVSVGFVEAMLGLGGVTLAVGLVVWLLERHHTEHFGGGVRRGLVSSVWWSALTMTQANAEEKPSTVLGRLVAIAWMTASVIVIAVFTAGITAQLTMKQLQGVVHAVDDLKSVRVGAVSETATLSYLSQRRIRYRTYSTPQDGLNALRMGALDAFVYDRPLLAWLAKEKFNSSVDVLDYTFDLQNYAIALPNDSPLRSRINLVMLNLISTEWWRDLTARYLGKE